MSEKENESSLSQFQSGYAKHDEQYKTVASSRSTLANYQHQKGREKQGIMGNAVSYSSHR